MAHLAPVPCAVCNQPATAETVHKVRDGENVHYVHNVVCKDTMLKVLRRESARARDINPCIQRSLSHVGAALEAMRVQNVGFGKVMMLKIARAWLEAAKR